MRHRNNAALFVSRSSCRAQNPAMMIARDGRARRSRTIALAALCALAAPAAAQDDGGGTAQSDWDGAPITAVDPLDPPSSTSPDRWSILTKFGDESCPAPKPDEIVVCATLPEGDRYRVPKSLRKSQEVTSGGQSWGSRVAGYDEMARVYSPDSCSPFGSYGFTGCAAAALRRWFAERRSVR
jgi:hypothetical protein